MRFSFDKGYVLDDIPILRNTNNSEIEDLSLLDGTFGLVVIDTTLAFCEPDTPADEPLRRWYHYFYDPSLLVILGEDPSKTKTATPSQKKSSKVVTGVAIGVTFLVIAIVITLILVAYYVPSFRQKFIPSSRPMTKSTLS